MSIYNLLCGIGAIQASPGTLVNTQEFVATGAGVWVKPGAATYAIIEIWGSGGSGGSAYNGNSISEGGGGGSYVRYRAEMLDLSATEDLLIGAGGAASRTNGYSGNPGSFSWFGRAIWALGGYGGRGQFTALTPATSYTPTVSKPWVLQLAEGGAGGGNGIPGNNATYAGAGGGGALNAGSASYAGGTSVYGGNGGAGNNNGNVPGVAGSQPGGGGGGAVWTTTSGAGGNGKIVVKSYA